MNPKEKLHFERDIDRIWKDAAHPKWVKRNLCGIAFVVSVVALGVSCAILWVVAHA